MSLACSEIALLSPALRVSHLEEYCALFSVFSVIRQFLCTRWPTPRTPTPLWPFFHFPAACGIWEVTFPGEWQCHTVRQLLLSQVPLGARAQGLTKAAQSAIPSPEMPGLLSDALGDCGFPLNSSQHVILRTSFLLGWRLWAGGGGGAPGSLMHEDRYTAWKEKPVTSWLRNGLLVPVTCLVCKLCFSVETDSGSIFNRECHSLQSWLYWGSDFPFVCLLFVCWFCSFVSYVFVYVFVHMCASCLPLSLPYLFPWPSVTTSLRLTDQRPWRFCPSGLELQTHTALPSFHGVPGTWTQDLMFEEPVSSPTEPLSPAPDEASNFYF